MIHFILHYIDREQLKRVGHEVAGAVMYGKQV